MNDLVTIMDPNSVVFFAVSVLLAGAIAVIYGHVSLKRDEKAVRDILDQ